MISMLRKAHRIYYRFSITFIFFALYPIIWYASRSPKRYRLMNFMRKTCAWYSSTASGIFYKIEYEEPIDWSRTYVICPNHTSNLDIMAVSAVAKNIICFMGKHELVDHLLLGIFFRSIDIPVNRESKISSYKAFKVVQERLQQGMSAVIFPEGTISKTYPPELQEFKNGPFRMAIDLKLPVLTITSADTWQAMWDDGAKLGTRPKICHIFVHKPVETAHMTIDQADELKDHIHSLMEQKLKSA